MPDASLSLVARSISREVGVLTDNDIKRAQINPSIISNLRRGYYRGIKGVIDPKDRDALLKLVNVIQQKEIEIAESKAVDFAASVGRNLSTEDDRENYLQDIRREGLSISQLNKRKSQPQQPQQENTDSKIKSIFDKYK